VFQTSDNDQAQAADPGKKKLVITEEHFQRVTQALVMRLRQHEESVMQDGTDTSILLVHELSYRLHIYLFIIQPCP
jgi:hypothetical protein